MNRYARSAKVGPVALAFSIALLAMLAFSSQAFAAKTKVSSIGGEVSGTLGANFNKPRGVAINHTGAGGVPAGTFYVVDAFNYRVQQFTPTGSFVRAWGWGVKDGSLEFQTCTSAAACQRGKEGNGAGQLRDGRGIAVDQASGILYMTDQGSRRVSIFSANGVFLGAFGWGALNTGNAFQFCNAVTGCKAPNTSTPTGGQAGKFGAEIGYPAVDPAGNIYVADSANRRVDVFTPTISGGLVTGVAFVRAFGFDVSTAAGTGFEVCTGANCKAGTTGAGLGQFGAASPSQVAISSTGTVYVLDPGNKRVEEFEATPAPLTAAFGSAALTAAFGTGVLQNLSLDRTTNNVYVSGKRSSAGQRVAVVELTAAGAAVETHGLDLNATSANGIAAAPPALGGNLYVSTENEGHRVLVLNEAPTTDPVTTFTGTTAEFTGTVVSNNFEVGYHFEYSIDGATWVKAPASDVSVGPEPGTIAVAQSVQGLTGSQLYRVRLVQNRPFAGGVAISPEVTFTTAAAAPAISVTAASVITDSSAVLSAKRNPQNQPTTYHFEYGTADCSLNPCASLPDQQLSAGNTGVSISQGLSGLQPATVYHFRLVASNGSGSVTGPDTTFETLEQGASLPDNRGYELVSPPDTNALFLGALSSNFNNFPTPLASPDGESVIFYSEGTLPGTNGNGTVDQYRVIRGATGWNISIASPSGAQAVSPAAGGVTSDHEYGFWNSGFSGGTLDTGPEGTDVLRRPDGSYEPIGLGSLGEDPDVEGRWISVGGQHVIFSTNAGTGIQLEPTAPPSGIAAIYDRGTGLPTKVVSLLPGNVTPAANANYLGSSKDGSAVVFEVEGTMYERRDNAETLEVATGALYAGVSDNGAKVFYLLGGDLFEYDADAEASTQIGSGGESTAVNISADGSHAYFSSPQQLDGGEGELGGRNLYVWDGTSVNFIAVLDPQDFAEFGGSSLVNLGEWLTAVGPEHTGLVGPARDPSRTNPSGTVLVFQSHGILGYPYDSEGFSEIYRYDTATEGLACLSCSTIEPPGSEAELQSTGLTTINSPTNAQSVVQNVTDDGSMVFFQTGEALVPEDTDGLSDVYRWRKGRALLISSGRSTNPDFLFGMSSDGSDVFFKTSDRLVPEDVSGGSGSIYDARVGGGFQSAQTVVEGCLEAACQGPGTAPPALPGAGSAALNGPGDPKPNRKKQGKHQKKKHKKKHKKKKHHKHQGKKKAGNRASHGRGGAK